MVDSSTATLLRPFVLSLVAGLSTTVGGLVIFLAEEPSPRFMAFTLALAAGVMTSVSALELLRPIIDGQIAALVWSLVGAAMYVLLSHFLPDHPHPPTSVATKPKTADDAEQPFALPCPSDSASVVPALEVASRASSSPPLSPAAVTDRARPDATSPPLVTIASTPSVLHAHLTRKRSEPNDHDHSIATPPPSRASDEQERARQLRLGLVMMVTLTAHNLPEGLAVAVGAMSSLHTGVVVTAAIAMHNIPEGLAIAVPIFAATRKRGLAVGMTFISGLSEPLGAALGILVLRPILNREVLDNASCAVGGMMCAVSILELLPEARKHREPAGMAVGFLAGWGAITATIGTLHV